MENKIDIYEILQDSIDRRASDIHLTCNTEPTFRVDGELRRMEKYPVLNREMLNQILKDVVKSDDLRDRFSANKKIDTSIEHGETRFRVHVFVQQGSPAFVLRLIPSVIPRFETLHLPEVVRSILSKRNGLVLVTGTTGSGKSTTLASMIDIINRTRGCHIVTVEDPVEFVHKHQKSIINQRELGPDVNEFSKAVTDAMREDPDILLVGEMRDLETIQNAITMAETGHLVFATLHTKSAAESVDRMIDVFPPMQQEQIRIQLANTLMAIISQQLIPKAGGGRVPICEIMIVNNAIRALIKDREKSSVSAINDQIQTNYATLHSQTFDMSIASLLLQGLITEEVAVEYASDVESLRRAVMKQRNGI